MVHKKMERKAQRRFWLWTFAKTTAGVVWEILKLLYYLVHGSYWLAQKINRSVERGQVEKRRAKLTARYQDFSIIETITGDYRSWEKKVFTSDSTIGLVLGARGSGKTAFGIKLLENVYAKTGKKLYALGFLKEEMPSWIAVVDSVKEITNDSFVLIDEGGVLFSSRSAMSTPNKLLSQLILISRHKNLSILFISQNSANLEINVLRQADYLVLKKSSLLQKEFERKIVQKLYEDTREGFSRYTIRTGLSYVHSTEFQGFVENPLPSFWKQSISKAFRASR